MSGAIHSQPIVEQTGAIRISQLGSRNWMGGSRRHGDAYSLDTGRLMGVPGTPRPNASFLDLTPRLLKAGEMEFDPNYYETFKGRGNGV